LKRTVIPVSIDLPVLLKGSLVLFLHLRIDIATLPLLSTAKEQQNMACSKVWTSTEMVGDPLWLFSPLNCTISHFMFDLPLYFTADP